MITLLVLLLVFPFAIVTGIKDCPSERESNDNLEYQLLEDLLCAYDPAYRPVKDHHQSVNVTVKLNLKYISFDAKEEKLIVQSWMIMSWQDAFLKWIPSNYGDIKEIPINSEHIWTPRMALHNTEKTYNEIIDTTCLLYSSGMVSCVPRISHTGFCQTSLEYWPYDTQNCTFFFSSWIETAEQVNFDFAKDKAVDLKEYENGPGWKLLNVTNQRYAHLPVLKYTFVLKREAGGPATVVVMPAIVIVVLTMVSLLLDVKNDTRLGLQCFSFFGHLIFLTEIGYDVPRLSLDAPVILLFIRDSMAVTLSSILLTVLMTSLREREGPSPAWVQSVGRLAHRGPGKYIVFTEFDPINISEDSTVKEVDDDQEQSQTVPSWILLANVINSVTFAVYLIIYLILICVYIPRDS